MVMMCASHLFEIPLLQYLVVGGRDYTRALAACQPHV
jgi:hypothetical protein